MTEPTPNDDAMRERVIDELQSIHAIKGGALRLFGSMLPALEKEREQGSLSDVDDLLEKMLKNFSGHEESTRSHLERLNKRLDDLGAEPSTPRELGSGATAFVRANVGKVGGQNHGANARDAFVFEHLEIASWELLEHLAERAGDAQTAELARTCRADDDEMAAMIRRNFPNVLSLMLASDGVPPMREAGEE